MERKSLLEACLFPLVLLIAGSGWAEGTMDSALSRMGVSELPVITSDSPWCLTDTECSFSVILPEISPAQVSIGSPRFPEGVRFLVSHKDLAVTGSAAGTSIRLVLVFSVGGLIQIPPLDIVVDGALYQLPFAPVEVFQNPRSLKPQVTLSFQDGRGLALAVQEDGTLPARVGQPVVLTVSLQYAAALNDTAWQLVPDALFQRLDDLQEEFNREAAEPSHQFQPVARFSLIPLRQGRLEVPPMELEVAGYDGEVRRLSTRALPVMVLPAEPASHHGAAGTSSDGAVLQAESGSALPDSMLDSAFVLPATQEAAPAAGVSLEKATELARLRGQERKAFPGAAVRQQRILLERELGLEPGRAEASWPLVWALAGLCAILLTLLFLSLVKRRRFFSAGAGLCLVLVLVALAVYGRPLLKPVGILASQTLSKIPEADAASLLPVAPYSLVEIEQEVLGWYHVSVDGVEGWIPCGMVVPIDSPSNAD